MSKPPHIIVVGGGPAGLRAAEVASGQGADVTIYDAMPSVGRKFLVAGKSGLNLTHEEPFDTFLARYFCPEMPGGTWREILEAFDADALRHWAAGLGIETFVASSGKVFPVAVEGRIKAAPLLRRWVERLRRQGVRFATRHRWIGIEAGRRLRFLDLKSETVTEVESDAIILALGGASWPHTGSDAAWVPLLREKGIRITDFQPANCGWEIDWPRALLVEAEGLPLKNLELRVGAATCRGELVITRYGLEGGPIYHLGPELRTQPEPSGTIDFKPDVDHETLVRRLGAVKRNFVREARRRWQLGPAVAALLKHLPDRGPWRDAESIAREVKACRISLRGPRPVEEAISSAGGVSWSELEKSLMLRRLPGVFLAGEMIDWEAPTGGYLLQACFATGTWAAQAAVAWVGKHASEREGPTVGESD